MSDKKLIAVVGATGAQGGSVLTYLLNSGRYRVRALTRNPASTQCLGLKTKWGSDLELWKCDYTISEEVIKAFEGCYGAFCVTDFWQDPKKMVDKEFDYGRIQIDSAVKTGIKHCIWSTLHNVTTFSEGQLQVPHFTNKALVEEYARIEFKGRDIDTSFSFVYPGMYMQNFNNLPGMGLKLNEEGILVNDPLPLNSTTRVPMINITEFGGFVLAMFDNLDKFKNGRMFAFNDYITMPEFLGYIAETLGTTHKYIQCTYEECYKITQELEIVHMFKWLDKWGYYGRENLGDQRKWVPGLKTIQVAVKGIDWKASLKPGFTQKITTKLGEVTGMVGEKLGAFKGTIVDTAEQMRERMSSKQAE